MSTAQPPTSARSNSALVVIDVQNGVMQASWNSESVVSTIADLVDRARKTGTEVVWVRHSSGELPIDSPQWQIVDALSPADGESIIEKTHGNTFEDTDFEEVLAGKDVGHLVVTGAQSDACVRSTIHGGFARGYDVTLVTDAHTTEDLTEWGAPPPGRSSPTRTCTGSSNPVPAGRHACRNRVRSTSPSRDRRPLR